MNKFGNLLVDIFHKVGLFGIGAATVYAAFGTFVGIWQNSFPSGASIQDLLLLFIYLEIGAMVGIYFKTNHMPVRFLIYIAITAITRHMVDLVTKGHEAMWETLVMGGTTLLLALSVLLIRFGSSKFPSEKKEEV
jgi:protein PsiE